MYTFDWSNINQVMQDAFDVAIIDPSKRWIGIGNCPRLELAIKFALVVQMHCARVFIGNNNSNLGVTVWIDILSWRVEGTN